MAQGSVLTIRPIRSFASPATSRIRHVESLAVPGLVSHNWTFGAGHIDLAIGPSNVTQPAGCAWRYGTHADIHLRPAAAPGWDQLG